ncbi:hypothetical protein [Fusobacterium ulcerans]|uniref:hypothetical protein n=1 Tax=Fusobacterium ulcerans TaxID=861 RepID=UPI002E78D201|nr:hypothetical protein [Fusobacterium ulcerans]MEE0138335.1 hypothetical protein [Fusobacterium ulcerans]
MEKEIKIQVPEGYEIDKEKSTFENIVFKKKKAINSWKDLKEIEGVFITKCSYIIKYEGSNDDVNKNIFLNEKYAKSALALAQISQLLPYYDSNVDWNRDTTKYCIERTNNKIYIDNWQSLYHILAFNSKEEAERFLKYNEQLVKDYFML